MSSKNNNTFIAYTASAGSGKTFRLTIEYLKIALSQPKDKFRKILAITFTVKATNEMKARIIEACEAFSECDKTPLKGRNKALFETLESEVDWPREEIITRSATLYKKILHNYSDFNISTIDSFSQKLIRSFAYELKLPLQFEVLIDNTSTIEYLQNELLAQVGGNDKEFTNLMVSFFENKLKEDDSIRIEDDIEKAIKIIFNDESQKPLEHLRNITSKEFKTIANDINKKYSDSKKKINSIGKSAAQLIESNGLSFNDFSGGNARGVANIFLKILEFPTYKISPTFIKLTNGEGNWFTKASKLSFPELENSLAELGSQLIEEQKKLTIFLLFRKNYPQIALLSKINTLYKTYQKQEEILLISEFNTTINKEVRGQPAPFIYEKVGEYFEHLLLDEFQDTSVIQWQNMVPLLVEILAKENQPKSLVVGDSKQAIYRFRGGETKQLTLLPNLIGANEDAILAEQQNILDYYFDKQSLDSNFRSKTEVIDFNNALFTFLGTHQELSSFEAIYKDAKQKSPSTNKSGYVTVSFHTKSSEEDTEEFKEQRINLLVEQVKKALNQGFRYSQLAVLARRNKELRKIAAIFQEQGFKINSKESLALNQEKFITVFPALVKWFTMPDHQILQAQIANTFQEVGIISATKHELNKKIGALKMKTVAEFTAFINEYNQHVNLDQLNYTELLSMFETYSSWLPNHIQESPYLSFFRNELWQVIQKEGNNIEAFLDWWEEKNHKLFIQSSEGATGINLMTIHKSKGLEFDVVFLPFADWKISASNFHTEFRWLPTNLLGEKISTMYLPMRSSLEKTEFEEEYLSYKNDNLLDHLNLLYVACTRAVTELHVITSKVILKKPKPLQDASEMNQIWSKFLPDDAVEFYSFGQPFIPKKVEKADNQNVLNFILGMNKKEFGKATVAVKNRASAIWNKEITDKIDFGTLVHELLEKITSKKDIDFIIDQAIANGTITYNEQPELISILQKVVESPKLVDFFDANKQVISEQPIVTPTGEEFIPDRLVKLSENSLKLLDFKTGNEAEKHKKQVNRYASILQEMGFSVEEKLIVYLNPFKIVLV